MCGRGQIREKRLYAVRYALLCVLCFGLVTGLLPSPGQGAAPPAPPEEAVQSAATRAQGSPVSSSQPQGFSSVEFSQPQGLSLLDSVTVSPLLESRYAATGPAGVLPSPYYGSGASAADKVFVADKPKSYLFSFDNGGNDSRYIGLARIDRLGVMESNKSLSNEYGAELMIGYKVTSLWSVLFGKGMQLESPGDTSVHFQDDGWRFKFVKKFW